MEDNQHQATYAVLAGLLLMLFFWLFTGPIEDGDLFWHLRTGQWIWQHHALPVTDPFTYTSHQLPLSQFEANRIPFLMRQYWLGQLALFGIWQAAGATGIVLLRAGIYTLVLAGLYLWLHRRSGGIFPVVLLCLSGFLLREYASERPLLFSFLFFPLVLFLLEQLRSWHREARPLGCWIGLPAVMLLWANTHASFMVGAAIIAIYLMMEVWQWWRDRAVNRWEIATLMVCSILITCVNPNGFMVIPQSLNILGSKAELYEFMSPYYAAVTLHEYYPAYWLFLLLAALVVLRSRRSIAPQHLLTLCALGFLSLKAIRHIPYFFLASPLLGAYLPQWRNIKRDMALGGVMIVITTYAAVTGDYWQLRIAPTFPVGAVNFINQEQPQGELFNFYDWGGYIIFFAQGKKVFVDGRGLGENVVAIHDQIMQTPEWQPIVDRFGINTITVPALNLFSDAVYPLVLALNDAANWVLVYQDSAALVYVRRTEANRSIIARHALGKEMLHAHVVARAKELLKTRPNRAELWLCLANAAQITGDRQGAQDAYRQALNLDPHNEWAKKMLMFSGGTR